MRSASGPAPLRILWVTKGLGAGGSERLLVDLALAHDPARVELEVAYVVPWKDSFVADLEQLGVKASCVGRGRGRAPGWVPRLARLVRSRQFDVVHSHSPLPAAVARIAARSRFGVRPVLVTTEHNAWVTYRAPTRVVNAITAPLDDAIVAVSPEVLDSIRGRARRRAEVVVHGVDVDNVRATLASRDAMRSSLGIGDDEIVVATVANYRPQKAWPDLLDAAALVVADREHVRFVGVGQGALRTEIEARHRELGFGDRFLLLGHRRDAVAVLAGADVFTLASTYEGYPVALMEALALGLPVVATEVGGVVDAVAPGPAGLLVPPRRPLELAAAILELVDDGSRRAELARGAKEAGERFRIERAARRLEAIYAHVTTQRAERAAKRWK